MALQHQYTRQHRMETTAPKGHSRSFLDRILEITRSFLVHQASKSAELVAVGSKYRRISVLPWEMTVVWRFPAWYQEGEAQLCPMFHPIFDMSYPGWNEIQRVQ